MKRFIQWVGLVLLAWGPWGAFLLAILDSAGIPLVEGVDFLLVTMAAHNARAGYLAAVLAIFGSIIGNLILYYVGRKGGEAYLDRKTQSGWPRRFRQWFHHYGGLAIFIPVLVPAPLPVKIFVLSAGALGMNRLHFVLIIAAARFLRYFGLVYLGTQMGTRPWEFLKHHSWQLLLLSVLVFLILYSAVRLKDYFRMLVHHHHSGHFR